MTRRAATVASLALALGALAAPLDAQVAVGDSLWRLGRISEAADAYRKAIAEDRNSVRANFRLAQTLAWSNNIDSALVLLRAARARVPDDPDLLFTEATYLAWARRFRDAIVRYDSVIAKHPEPDYDYVRIARARTLSWSGDFEGAEAGYRAVLAQSPTDRDARFGLAQLRSWSGNLDDAARVYSALLAEDGTEVRTLVALAQLRLWQARVGDAAALAARARALDSANADVAEIERAVRTARRPRTDFTDSWSEDSDRNENVWQTVGASWVPFGNLRVSASVANLDARDPSRHSNRAMGDVALSLPVWRGSASLVLAGRALSPDAVTPGDPRPPTRSVFSGRLSTQQRMAGGVTANLSLARWPLDEVAALMPLALDITQWETGADWRVNRDWRVTANVGGLGYSDGNARRSWAIRGSRRLPQGFGIGAALNGFAYDERVTQYFSPPTFVAGDVTGTWSRDGTRWNGGVGVGFGVQRIDTLAVQGQWHADGRIGRQWRSGWGLEISGGRSTSAAASAVGAYSYSTLSLLVRRHF